MEKGEVLTRLESILLDVASADWREGERFAAEWRRMVEGHKNLPPPLPHGTNPIYKGGVTPPGGERGNEWEKR